MSLWLRRSARPRVFDDQIYQALIRQGDVVFDVGANVGEVSAYLSKVSGPSGRIFAFEPFWPAYQALCASIENRSRRGATIVPLPFGLADEEMARPLSVPDGDSRVASLAPPEAWKAIHGSVTIDTYRCAFVRLDAFLRVTGAPHPAFVKIDVEGAELLVLKGAGEILQSSTQPLMLIEVFAPWEKAFGYQPWAVLSYLSSYGYSFLFACPDGLVEYTPTAGQPFPAEFARGYNLVAFNPQSHAHRIESLEELRLGGGKTILPIPAPPEPNIISA